MIALCAWLGAACMVVAPFIIDTAAGKWLAIAGLAMLTVQAVATRSHNLIVLNVLGIGGYLYALYL